MKKAQGLSLNTIIIAAIVLIVLVVLWAIFTGRMGAFATGLKGAEDKKCDGEGGLGGAIVEPEDCAPPKRAIKTTDATGTQVCCVP